MSSIVWFNSYLLNTPITFARIVDSGGSDIGYSVTCDSSSNIYLAGQYSSLPVFILDQNFTRIASISPNVSSTNGAFVCKFDSSGNYQYTMIVDASGTDIGYGVTCDSSGNMYFAGQYNGTSANIYSVNSSNVVTTIATLPNSNSIGAFVCKFNSSGTYQYSRLVDGAGADTGYAVACDSSGNMYLTGTCSAANIYSVNSSNVVTTVGTLPNSNGTCAFVCKFDSSGTYQYSRLIDAINNDNGYAVTCDSSGNMYFAGQYQGTSANIYSVNSSNVVTTIATLPNTNASSQAAFVSKFDSSGTYKYTRIVDGAGADTGYAVTCDSSGNMYFAGTYIGINANIYSINSSNVVTTIATLPNTNASSQAAFVSKFDSSGVYQYSRLIDASGDDNGYAVTCDSSGNMYFAGQYIGTNANIYAVNSSNVSTLIATLPNPTNYGAFCCKFNSSGTYQYSRIVDSSSMDTGRSVTCDSSGNVYLAGYYIGSANIYSVNNSNVSTIVGTLKSPSGAAVFLLKFDSLGNYNPNLVTNYVNFARIIGFNSTTIGYGVTCDSSGNMYLVGRYIGSGINVYSINNSTNLTISSTLRTPSSESVFVSKFNSSGTYQYSICVDGGSSDIGYAVTCDSSGNMYLTGSYRTTSSGIYFINSSNIVTTVGTLPVVRNEAAFVSKFDSSGVYQYSRIVDANSSDYGYSVACDSSGNMYFAGQYGATGANIYSVNSSNVVTTIGTLPNTFNNTTNAFCCKFDSNGTYQYTLIVGANFDGVVAYGITCDSSGNIYLAGSYSVTNPSIIIVNTSNVATTVGTLPNPVINTAFVCKFNSSGVYQYSRLIDASGDDTGRSVTCDSIGNMYFAGYYTGTNANIYAVNSSNVVTTIATLPNTNASSQAAFVSKFNSSGVYQYSRIVDASSFDIGYAVTCDSSGNVYFAGNYTGTNANIYSVNSSNVVTTIGTLPLNYSAIYTAFVSKFDSSGNYVFSRVLHGPYNSVGYSVACDPSNNMILGGQYQGFTTLYDQNSTSLGTLPQLANTNPAINAMMLKFDSSGLVYNPYTTFASVSTSDFSTYGKSVACDLPGNMYFTGYYRGTSTNVYSVKSSNIYTLIATLPIVSNDAVYCCKFSTMGTYQYSIVVDSIGNDGGNSVACDLNGNMYLAGYYTSTNANIYSVNSSNVSTLIATLPNPASTGAFVSKFNSSGVYQYSRIVDASSGDTSYTVTCDSSGNMYFAGNYTGTSASIYSVNSSNVVTTVGTLPNPASTGAFVSKFNSSGTYQYSRIIDSSSSDIGYSVTCDSSGNMYLAGIYSGTSVSIYAVNSSNVVTTVGTLPNSIGSRTAFVSKFDSSGTYQYSALVDASSSFDYGYSVTCDSSGNMYLAGYYAISAANIYFVNSSNVVTTIGTLPNNSPLGSAFCCKFDSSGTYQYSITVDGTYQGYGVTCDSNNNMYFVGQYGGANKKIYFINSSNVVTTVGTLPNTGSTYTTFCCKFDSSGTYQYSRLVNSTGSGTTNGVSCDSIGNLYLCGTTRSSSANIYAVTSSNVSTIVGTLPIPRGDYNSFVCKFDSSGNYNP